MSHDWTKDWIAFTDKVASIGQCGEPSEFVNTFSGATVRWHGVLTEKNLSEPAPSVEIDTAEVSLDLGGGRTASLSGFALPVADREVESWNSVPLGAEVHFEAQFVSSSIPFAAVEVKTLSSGRTLVMLRLTDGRLIDPGSGG